MLSQAAQPCATPLHLKPRLAAVLHFVRADEASIVVQLKHAVRRTLCFLKLLLCAAQLIFQFGHLPRSGGSFSLQTAALGLSFLGSGCLLRQQGSTGLSLLQVLAQVAQLSMQGIICGCDWTQQCHLYQGELVSLPVSLHSERS